MNENRVHSFIKSHPQGCYYLILSLAVTALFFLENAYILAMGHELIWSSDALPIYANFLVYGSNALANMFEAFTNGG